MNRDSVFLVGLIVAMVLFLVGCIALLTIAETQGEQITIRVDGKYHCIENGDAVYKISTDSGTYTTMSNSSVYQTLTPGLTYEVKLYKPTFLMPRDRVIYKIISAPCVEDK